ncbi:SH3 domain-containing protein [Streptomyces cremeus]|uniref:SH3 domain-containing protein n=1 Tax=Streptomyces cremeus TaxID=66881 RepID=A0ABV5PG56_STRCM
MSVQLKMARTGLGAVTMAVALAVCAPTTASAAPAATAGTGAVQAAVMHGVGGKVTAHGGQFVRERPTSSSRKIGSYRNGAIVRLACKVRGQNIHGNALWYKLWDRSGWLSAKYVHNFGYVGWCANGHRTADAAPSA